MDGVHIEVNADEKKLKAFITQINNHPPPLAVIQSLQSQRLETKNFSHFKIVKSLESGQKEVLLTPDFGLCEDCRREINHAHDRRKGYAFTTCINCGPRFSITQNMPYDRENTTMESFEMCEECQQEYDDPINRRYYSQTNSCKQCGIELTWHAKNQTLKNDPHILSKILKAWSDGLIVAIKGIGGYLLTCDATKPDVIKNLRQRKNRPEKPLALMFPDVELLKKHCQVQSDEEKMLESPEAPILLLPMKPLVDELLPVDQIAPGMGVLGCMLPYAPLYELLLTAFGKPIIATSGNRSGSPIIFNDKVAKKELFNIADILVSNHREIVIPQDDSVIRFSPLRRVKMIYRRSRGLSPTVMLPHLDLNNRSVLAMGGGLKSTFSLTVNRNLYTSQYLGDLEAYLSQQSFDQVLTHFFKVFDFQPECILADKHPGYHATQRAQNMAEALQIPLFRYQHHKAHFMAIVGEQRLWDEKEAILGVIWDGTGYGDDGAIWGGEFFKYGNQHLKRVAHLPYFKHIAGDKMSREPRISALSVFGSMDESLTVLKPKFKPTEWQIYRQILNKTKALNTSSMGRLFDAVAAITGLISTSTFEGQAAMMLEHAAREYIDKNKTPDPIYHSSQTGLNLRALLNDVINNKEASLISARFHVSLVDYIRHQANQNGCKKLAFSGGVFQNALLVDLISEQLGGSFELFFHHTFSSNDENISFGQLMLYRLEKQ